MSKKKGKKTAEQPVQNSKKSSGGALRGLRSGMKQIAGTEDGKKGKQQETLFSKITDILLWVALVAFLGWFLYKKITM